MRILIRNRLIELLGEKFDSFTDNKIEKIYEIAPSVESSVKYPLAVIVGNKRRVLERNIQSYLFEYEFKVVLVVFKKTFEDAENQLEIIKNRADEELFSNHYLNGLADTSTKESVYMVLVDNEEYRFGSFKGGIEGAVTINLKVRTERKGPF